MSELVLPYCTNVLITGATGFVGRHILYELVNIFTKNMCPGKIYVLLRSKASHSFKERIEHILKHDYAPEYFKSFSYAAILERIELIEGSLNDSNLGMKMMKAIPENEKLYVIHSAGSVNLFDNKKAEEEVNYNNWNGTKNLLSSLKVFNYKFIYISTAFSCGIVSGMVGDDFSKYKEKIFRNPYEKYKNLIETMVQEYCGHNEKEYQILRPSVVCGRLLDSSLYYTSKFDVIYGWAKFFWSLKQQGSNEHIRVHMSANSKINIVPVDFVAKSVVSLFAASPKQVNITYPQSLMNRSLYGQMLNVIEYLNYSFVDEKPANLNKSEKIYYRLIDKVYNPYLNHCDNDYDNETLLKAIDREFMTTIDLNSLTRFAISNNFDELQVN
ncbi:MULTISPECIES: SDR family oxidoreductase [unclassified Paenibacillus]|uniref:SDR family oxidoreductase n=1 Tax=unclassified Paenibacillus TaxID=185978 RepID=UPI00240551BB|nr:MULTISPECIES: SDR family oxidoreductase [unclassified Paenibacillus]MDF9844106.1 nucleoside-diphosphate-sugar epimerase [Paenibacillus sp. PastF-2]MDF9850772.1 nucleoside-diphosphate-sugar epimerase [Paenibacillus sp. PastM-2]MDF9857342.1 nucleoside-diphosphate-sugar epimerase [Paenibacillus sp. PastF-1]MDH6482550.1 nucleoside-diphosphate-sugar epimerase [Paenibacillus sp. PastH-2]MDH6509978.1 nucleoside-diphosphate-sugar epimerase [Paenibacillus sp. PastM-3]